MWSHQLQKTFGALFMAVFLHSSMAGFAEVPVSVTVEIGSEPAVFRCRHMSLDDISWRVNGSTLGSFPEIAQHTIKENGSLFHTLTIPARSEYNETKVVCIAFFLNGSLPEMTDPATLILIDSPSSPTPPVTTDVLTTVPPTTGPGNFELTPSPLTMAVEQRIAVFRCRHLNSAGIIWLVNGESLSETNFTNFTVTIPSIDGVLTYVLSVGTLLEYNRSSIQCVASFVDGSSPLFAEPVTLLIQDTPGEVQNASCQRNYTSNVLITTWNPLFSLDINGTDPDIVYTVEVFKTTCGQNLMMNRTVVMDSNATHEVPDMMQIYRAVIAARNNVSEAMNGPSVEMKETFISLRGFILFNLVMNSQVTLQSTDPVPSYYTMRLESLDGSGQDLLTNVTVERIGETINMNMSEHRLPRKSLWRVIILAYECEVHREETELSTHDIQNVTVTASSSLPGQIRIKGDFVDESTANGVFVIIYSLTDYSDVHYIAKQAEETFDFNVMNLPGTEHSVSVFPLENGLPFTRVVTSTKSVTVNATTTGDKGSAGSPLPIKFQLQPSTNGVCITCNFMDQDGALTNCLVVVHQRISQLNSSGLLTIVSSHRFNRSGDTAYGCIEGVKLEQYQIGVVSGNRVIPSTVPTVDVAGMSDSVAAGAAAGAVIGLLIVLIVIVVVVIVILANRTKRSSGMHPCNEVGRLQSDNGGSVKNGSDGCDRYVQPQFLMEEKSEQSAGVNVQPAPTNVGNEPPPRDRERSGGVTYAEVVLPRSRHNQLPTDPEKVVYDDPQKYLNPAGQTAQVKLPSVHAIIGDCYMVEYSEVIPHTKTVVRSEAPNTNPTPEKAKAPAPDPPTDPSPGPGTEPEQEAFTAEVVFRRLHPYSSKWKSLADALSFDDELVDEIFTNDVIDEPCLRVMIEMYLQRSYPEPSWEAIDAALEKVLNQPTEDASTSVQETNSSSNSQVVNDTVEIPPENDSSAEAGKSFPVPGTTDDAGLSMASVEQAEPDKEEDAADTFVSQPDLQSAQSSESGSDNSQLCLVHTSKPSGGDPSTVDQLRTLPVSCFPSLEPVSDDDCTTIQPFSTVCSEGHEEDLLCQTSPIHCQESDEEETDYATAMKQLLGISQELPTANSSVNVERPVLARVKDEKPAPLPWNCVNLNKSNVGEHAHTLGRVLECIE